VSAQHKPAPNRTGWRANRAPQSTVIKNPTFLNNPYKTVVYGLARLLRTVPSSQHHSAVGLRALEDKQATTFKTKTGGLIT
jgi:hypothetical protein